MSWPSCLSGTPIIHVPWPKHDPAPSFLTLFPHSSHQSSTLPSPIKQASPISGPLYSLIFLSGKFQLSHSLLSSKSLLKFLQCSSVLLMNMSPFPTHNIIVFFLVLNTTRHTNYYFFICLSHHTPVYMHTCTHTHMLTHKLIPVDLIVFPNRAEKRLKKLNYSRLFVA